jgi:hypothetical protein
LKLLRREKRKFSDATERRHNYRNNLLDKKMEVECKDSEGGTDYMEP